MTVVLLTCEHGGHRVPPEVRFLFAGAREMLESHRGWDPGALWAAKRLSKAWAAPLLCTTVSRLVVDANRSPGHPGLLSQYTKSLPGEEQQRLLDTHYHPHRRAVEEHVAVSVQKGRTVVHVAVHSFTPVWEGQRRKTDVGLLYDPARKKERTLCAAWAAAMRERAPELTVHRNQPYRGVSDGLCTALRRQFPAGNYLGIELELNQRWLLDGKKRTVLLSAVQASFLPSPPLGRGQG